MSADEERLLEQDERDALFPLQDEPYEEPPAEPSWLVQTYCPGGLSWDCCQASDCGVSEDGHGCVYTVAGYVQTPGWPEAQRECNERVEALQRVIDHLSAENGRLWSSAEAAITELDELSANHSPGEVVEWLRAIKEILLPKRGVTP